MRIAGRDLFRSVDTHCWDSGNGAVVLSLEQLRPNISTDVLDAVERAADAAERSFATLVITSASRHFGFGAPLNEGAAALLRGEPQGLDAELARYQRTMLRLRHARVPTVAAVRGVAISGACELLMHCTRVVAYSNSRIGLAEPSWGVVPSGGGLKEFARRAAASADPDESIRQAFAIIARSTVSTTSQEAQQLGFLQPHDQVETAPEPLAEAIQVGLALQASGYVAPPVNPAFRVSGDAVRRQLRAEQTELLDKGEITPHQFEINMRVAEVLCGGEAAGVRTEAELLALERLHFVALAQMPLTQARQAHVRSTGKVLVN